jgi:hypothetical protein
MQDKSKKKEGVSLTLVELEMTSPQNTWPDIFTFSAWKNKSDIFTKQKLCQIM